MGFNGGDGLFFASLSKERIQPIGLAHSLFRGKHQKEASFLACPADHGSSLGALAAHVACPRAAPAPIASPLSKTSPADWCAFVSDRE